MTNEPKGFLRESDRVNRTYLAGPMTGLPNYNFEAFNAAAALLRGQGKCVINPAEHGVVDGAVWQDYLRYDMAKLATCESITLLPGWSNSKGASLELMIAEALGMKVEYLEGAEKILDTIKIKGEQFINKRNGHVYTTLGTAIDVSDDAEIPVVEKIVYTRNGEMYVRDSVEFDRKFEPVTEKVNPMLVSRRESSPHPKIYRTNTGRASQELMDWDKGEAIGISIVEEPSELRELCPECGNLTVEAKGIRHGGGVHCVHPGCGYWFCY